MRTVREGDLQAQVGEAGSRLQRMWRWLRGARLAAGHWARSWQFWLVVGLAALLRLPPVNHSPFGIDTALLMLEANRAAQSHLLPGTGIYNSLLALNSPIYTYLLLPFANAPEAFAFLTALLNIVAVGALFVFTERFFGRSAATVAGLLYATACYAAYMSIFIWQQTILAPFTVAAFITLYLGVVGGRRDWFIWHCAIVAFLIQIYPLMATLLPLTLVGLLLTWRVVGWRRALCGVGVGLLFFVPTILFEIASGGYDIPVYQQYLATPTRVDGQVFNALAAALGPRPANFLGAASPYTPVAQTFGWLTWCVVALLVLSVLWLAALVLVPPVRAWRRHDRADALRLLRGATWRARLLLLLWPLVFIAATARHSSPIYIHYPFVLTPVLYVTMGLFLVDAPRTLDPYLRAWLAGVRGDASWLARPALANSLVSASRILLDALLLGVVISQLIVTTVFMNVITLGQADYTVGGELPTGGYTAALDAATRAARSLGASDVFIAADPNNPYIGQYFAAQRNGLRSGADPGWTSYVATDCLLTPATAPGLLLATNTTGLALPTLAQDPRIGTPVSSVEVAPQVFYPLYRLAPGAPSSAASAIAMVNGELRLESARVAAPLSDLPRRLITEWTVLQSTPPGPSVEQYHVHLLFTTTPGVVVDVVASCAPSHWIAGQRLMLVVAVPGTFPTDYLAPRKAGGSDASGISVRVDRDTHTWYRPSIGSLTLETAKENVINPQTLTPDAVPIPLARLQY